MVRPKQSSIGVCYCGHIMRNHHLGICMTHRCPCNDGVRDYGAEDESDNS